MCPANNGDITRVPFVSQANAIKCKACNLRPDVTDIDVRANKYWVELAFGRNTAGVAGVIDESMLVGYMVQIVDAHGYKKADTGPAGNVLKKPAQENPCCDRLEYSTTLKGDWPAGGSHFMIVPYTCDQSYITADGKCPSNSSTYMLPVGTLSAAFVDVQEGTVKIIAATITMTVNNPDAFAANPASVGIVQESIAESIAGVEKSMVNVKNITSVPASGRRLGGHGGAKKLSIDYEIMIPSTSNVAVSKDDVSAAMTSPTFTSKMNTKAAAQNIDLGATGVQATVTETPIVAALPETPTGAAPPMAGINLMALIIALAGRQLF